MMLLAASADVLQEQPQTDFKHRFWVRIIKNKSVKDTLVATAESFC